MKIILYCGIMDKNQVLRLLASAAATVMLTACGATMKPDHPQVYDTFKERRPPKENVFVESGTLEDQPQERASRFTPYTGPVNSGDGRQQDMPTEKAAEKPATQEPVQLGTPRMTAPDGTSPTVPSQEQRTVWERLKNKFSSLTPIEPTTLVAERKAPVENGMMLADMPDVSLAQGSADDYSYYEMADEIVLAAPVETILMASANSSSPLVDVPEPEPYSDLKKEGEKLNNQNLKDVPQMPKKKTEKPKVTHKPKAEKPVRAKEKQAALSQEPSPIIVADASDYTIEDKQAEIVYQNDQKLVTGFIGVIRGRAVN